MASPSPLELILPSGQVAYIDEAGGTARIVMNEEYAALVDLVDLEIVGERRWHPQVSHKTVYARGHLAPVNGFRGAVRLHRMLLDAPPEMQVDHKNHDGLDNRRCNLRLASQSQNLANARSRGTNSGYRGVHCQKKSGRYVSYVGQPPEYLGFFTDPWEAAEAYNKAATEMYGEFAILNERIPA